MASNRSEALYQAPSLHVPGVEKLRESAVRTSVDVTLEELQQYRGKGLNSVFKIHIHVKQCKFILSKDKVS